MASPVVKKEKITVQTALMGLNMDTSTGPLFFIAHAFKLRLNPFMAPACAHKKIEI